MDANTCARAPGIWRSGPEVEPRASLAVAAKPIGRAVPLQHFAHEQQADALSTLLRAEEGREQLAGRHLAQAVAGIAITDSRTRPSSRANSSCTRPGAPRSRALASAASTAFLTMFSRACSNRLRSSGSIGTSSMRDTSSVTSRDRAPSRYRRTASSTSSRRAVGRGSGAGIFTTRVKRSMNSPRLALRRLTASMAVPKSSPSAGASCGR